MKKIIRLTERDLTNIVKSVLNEKRLSASELIKDMTVRDIVDVVNSFSNKQISVKEVKEKIEYMFRPSGGRMNENMDDSSALHDMEVLEDSVYTDSREDINYDIKSMDCEGSRFGNMNSVMVDDDDTIVIRYCKGDDEELEYLKEKGKRLLYRNYGM
jgi:DNA-binding transcriptional ArsR family regulator